MIFETFSFRKKQQERSGAPDVYAYDQIPAQLRHQIGMAISEGIGTYHIFSGYEFDTPPNSNDWWELIDRICTKEIFSYLQQRNTRDLARGYLRYVQTVENTDDLLSVIEIACVALSNIDTVNGYNNRGSQISGSEALEEINGRFEQHGIGYSFDNGKIISKDTALVHKEIVRPALLLVSAPKFEVVNNEFMAAHANFRTSNHKDCITACGRAFESTLKVICDLESWPYNKGDRATELIAIVNNNGLFSRRFDKSFNAYIAMLRSGLPNVRNDVGAHGEGLDFAPVTAAVARFALNMTATNILFLLQCYKSRKCSR